MTDQLLLVGAAAFVSSIVSGLGGFGGAFIIIIALASVVGPKEVIPLIAVYAVCNNASRIYIYRKTVDWPLAIKFTLASLPGVYVGAQFLKWVPEQAFLGILGVLLLSAIPFRRYLKKIDFTPGIKTIIGFGVVFGVVSGAAAGSGMFVIAALSSVGLTGPLLLGTDAVIGAVNAVSRASTYWLLGLLTWDLLIMGLMMGLITLPGAWVASRIVAAMGDHLHAKLIEALIMCGGLWLLYKAVFYETTG